MLVVTSPLLSISMNHHLKFHCVIQFYQGCTNLQVNCIEIVHTSQNIAKNIY